MPELEPDSIFTDEPRIKLDASREIARLQPLLAEYNPHTQPTEYYQPPRNYGVIIAKVVGYSLMVAITLAIGLMILAPFIALGGC